MAGALGATQKSVGYLSGLNHKEKSIPFFLRSSVGGPIRSKSCSSVKGCINNNTKKLVHTNNIPELFRTNLSMNKSIGNKNRTIKDCKLSTIHASYHPTSFFNYLLKK
jgi:hypothetical protein